jgi:hypothetical protein
MDYKDPWLESQQTQQISHLQNIQTGSRVHPASYSFGTRVISLRVNQPGSQSVDSPPSSAKVKNEWCYSHLILYAFIVWSGKTLHFYLLLMAPFQGNESEFLVIK